MAPLSGGEAQLGKPVSIDTGAWSEITMLWYSHEWTSDKKIIIQEKKENNNPRI